MSAPFPRIKFPELFFGFVAPIGTDITSSISEFEAYLKRETYRVEIVKVTDIFRVLKDVIEPHLSLKTTPLFDRYETYISYGDLLRQQFNDNAVLARTSIFQINAKRNRPKMSAQTGYEKVAYIIHQFKRAEEIDLLRAVYGRLFFQVSVYSSKATRVSYLAQKFESDFSSNNGASSRALAEQIIKRDEKEHDNQFGQNVSDIFHDADYIINNDIAANTVRDQVCRFCELIFGANFISPNKQEYGMFLAKSAALRSLDLSRQVGAAIFTPDGDIVALGCNEVPKANGGAYWCDEVHDDRDYLRTVDPNEKRKKEIMEEMAQSISNAVPSANRHKIEQAISDSKFMDALEYGRIIHAEMAAITDAARTGRTIANGQMYCTTFPCHMCAKHIVAAGIKTVTFLEPYPKSLAERLHSDSISVESGDRGKYRDYPATEFIHFFGVTPRRYRELFEGTKRKSNGEFVKYKEGSRQPIMNYIYPFYERLELEIIEPKSEFMRKLRALANKKSNTRGKSERRKHNKG
ncbi:MAG: dCMP deaminase [Methylobacteriaceae bacterium]|nr:dCMP deaminase [Methylobacteriaceae bacterium]